MDCIDKSLVKSASLHMISFDLIKFKIDYPSLYSTIRETVKYACSQSNKQGEILGKDVSFG